MQLSYRLRNYRQTAFILLNLGRVTFADHRVELAEEYLQKSINIYLELGESYDLAMAYIHLGRCFANQPDQNAARGQFHHVIRIGQELNKFHLVYYGLVNIARTYVIENQTEKALEIFVLLGRCPIEYKRIQEDFDHLQADLQPALPEGQMEAVMKQVDGKDSLEKARADVITYVQEHETG